jgi:hypothetical protein
MTAVKWGSGEMIPDILYLILPLTFGYSTITINQALLRVSIQLSSIQSIASALSLHPDRLEPHTKSRLSGMWSSSYYTRTRVDTVERALEDCAKSCFLPIIRFGTLTDYV